MAFCYYVAGWSAQASMLAGVALSANSIAVVYSVLTETGLAKSKLGKQLMAATFVTNMGTALALSALFLQPTPESAGFVLLSLSLVAAAVLFSGMLFHNKQFANKVVESEIKYLFVLLLALMALAAWAGSQAILPAFVLGLLMAPYFADWRESKEVKTRLRTVAYAIITPFFFLAAGLRVSLAAVAQAWPLFVELFALKEITKFVGAYIPAKRYLPEGQVYTSLLMSTGLTFGTIAAVFGLSQGIIDQTQFSVLLAVEVASAVVPTVIAQKWFRPRHQEDIVNGG
jgi:Kef-type K+ transport system membrane component KefB